MKLVARTILTILSLALLVFALVWVQNVDPIVPKETLPTPLSFQDTLAKHSYDLDSLKRIIGDNKRLPPGFEIAGDIAFSAYPELKDISIDMVLVNGGAPMESRPLIKTLFGTRKYRRYLVLLNNERPSNFE